MLIGIEWEASLTNYSLPELIGALLLILFISESMFHIFLNISIDEYQQVILEKKGKTERKQVSLQGKALTLIGITFAIVALILPKDQPITSNDGYLFLLGLSTFFLLIAYQLETFVNRYEIAQVLQEVFLEYGFLSFVFSLATIFRSEVPSTGSLIFVAAIIIYTLRFLPIFELANDIRKGEYKDQSLAAS